MEPNDDTPKYIRYPDGTIYETRVSPDGNIIVTGYSNLNRNYASYATDYYDVWDKVLLNKINKVVTPDSMDCFDWDKILRKLRKRG